MNGDALTFVEKFLSGEGAELPKDISKSQQLVLFALRSVRTEFLDKLEETLKKQEKQDEKIDKIFDLLFGKKEDGTDGMLYRFLQNERRVDKGEKAITWLQFTVYGSIIGGFVVWLLSRILP